MSLEELFISYHPYLLQPFLHLNQVLQYNQNSCQLEPFSSFIIKLARIAGFSRIKKINEKMLKLGLLQTSQCFKYITFGWASLFTVICGHFMRPKNAIMDIKSISLHSLQFFSILNIRNFVLFSFSNFSDIKKRKKLFLTIYQVKNDAWYTSIYLYLFLSVSPNDHVLGPN